MWNQSDSNDSKKMNFPVSVVGAETEGKIDKSIESPLLSSADDKFEHRPKYLSDQCSSGIDSGFLSGPQLESSEIDYEDDDDDDNNNSANNDVKESTENINNKSVVAAAPVANTAAIINTNTTTATDIESNFDTGFIDSGCIEEEAEVEKDFYKKIHLSEQQGEGKMILDSEIDSGLTEWFCNLTLRTANQPINNLNAGQQNNEMRKISKDNILPTGSNKTNWQKFFTQDNEGVTQFHLACLSGYLNVIAALIRMAPHPCLLDIENDDAQSAIHIATITSQPQVIRMLLIAGAEPTLRDRNGNTALHIACMAGDLECVKALTVPINSMEIQEAKRCKSMISTSQFLKVNNSTEKQSQQPQYFPCAQLPTDLELRNYDGERCVHLAAQGSHVDVLRHLIWFGADINAREGKSGRTPLHIAIEQCNENLANFLIEECQQKINLETVTYSGLTPYQFACILQNQKLQNDLRKYGAEPLTPPDSSSDTDGSDMESEFDDSQIFEQFHDQDYFIPSTFNGVQTINVA